MANCKESELELSQGYSTKSIVCCRFISLTKAGVVHLHGPVDNRCLGSRKHPGEAEMSDGIGAHGHGVIDKATFQFFGIGTLKHIPRSIVES